MTPLNELKKNYGNEMSLILLCCRIYFKTATYTGLQFFLNNNEIKWDEFLQLAGHHKIRPLVFKIIYLSNIPTDVKLKIKSSFIYLANQNFNLAVESERVIQLLKSREIDAVPYKGTTYSKQFFNDFYLRESSDIDIIISPSQLDAAIKILETDGYLSELGDIYQYLGPKYTRFFKDFNFNKFQNEKRKFHIELHWAVTEKEIGLPDETNKYLFDFGTELDYSQNYLKTIKPGSHFSAIFIHHAFKDNFNTLKNITDISAAFAHEELISNVAAVKSSFTGIGLSKALAIGNSISEKLLGVAYFSSKHIEIPHVDYFINDLCCQRPIKNEDDKTAMAKWLKKSALLKDTFVKRIEFYFICLSFRFIPGRFDFRAVQFPRPFFFLYYIIKPFRTLLSRFNRKGTRKANPIGR